MLGLGLAIASVAARIRLTFAQPRPWTDTDTWNDTSTWSDNA